MKPEFKKSENKCYFLWVAAVTSFLTNCACAKQSLFHQPTFDSSMQQLLTVLNFRPLVVPLSVDEVTRTAGGESRERVVCLCFAFVCLFLYHLITCHRRGAAAAVLLFSIFDVWAFFYHTPHTHKKKCRKMIIWGNEVKKQSTNQQTGELFLLFYTWYINKYEKNKVDGLVLDVRMSAIYSCCLLYHVDICSGLLGV